MQKSASQSDPASVGYDEMGGMGARRCGNCVHYMDDERCEIVSGRIDPGGICDMYDSAGGKTASIREFVMASFASGLQEKTSASAMTLEALIAFAKGLMEQKYIQDPLDKMEAINRAYQEKRELGQSLMQSIRNSIPMGSSFRYGAK